MQKILVALLFVLIIQGSFSRIINISKHRQQNSKSLCLQEKCTKQLTSCVSDPSCLKTLDSCSKEFKGKPKNEENAKEFVACIKTSATANDIISCGIQNCAALNLDVAMFMAN